MPNSRRRSALGKKWLQVPCAFLCDGRWLTRVRAQLSGVAGEQRVDHDKHENDSDVRNESPDHVVPKEGHVNAHDHDDHGNRVHRTWRHVSNLLSQVPDGGRTWVHCVTLVERYVLTLGGLKWRNVVMAAERQSVLGEGDASSGELAKVVTFGVLVGALVLVALVLFWSGRYGGRNRQRGTSLRRSPRAHTTRVGTPKVAFLTRGDAEASARKLSERDGVVMNVYQCATCAKWHIGHGK